MTVVEKAAYLKGLAEGLGVTPDSKEGKLWAALNDLLSDMAHEIEDLQESNLDLADIIDDMGEDLSYLEELTCDLDTPTMTKITMRTPTRILTKTRIWSMTASSTM